MKIIYFGTDVFYECFKYLVNSEHEIVALYTYHNENEYIREDKVAALAKNNNIPIRYNKMTLDEAQTLFSSNDCDLFFSAEYDSKIPIPDTKKFRGINIHNSLLPEGKGYFPIEMRIYKGYDYGGVTIHQLTDNFDEGAIVMQKKFQIAHSENDRNIYNKCHYAALELTKVMMSSFDSYWNNAQPQQGPGSYWSKPTLTELTIDRNFTVAAAKHTYRAFGRLCFVKNNNLVQKVALITDLEDNTHNDCFIMPLKDGAVKVLAQK